VLFGAGMGAGNVAEAHQSRVKTENGNETEKGQRGLLTLFLPVFIFDLNPFIRL
tara:strand:+ start:106 stop:267 length:162 start_codon:yes stop_codon:yes gene_type:complete